MIRKNWFGNVHNYRYLNLPCMRKLNDDVNIRLRTSSVIKSYYHGYFDKKHKQIKKVKSLEELIVRRRRVNIGNMGLSYKSEGGFLVIHSYVKGK